MSIQAIANEARLQIEDRQVGSMPSGAIQAIGAQNLSPQGVRAIVDQVVNEQKHEVLLENQQFDMLVKALIDPITSAGEAENIQVPGQIDGTQLYYNETVQSCTVPAGANSAVIVLDAVGSARNGETGATIYWVASQDVSQTEPQNVYGGSIITTTRLTTNLNNQLFDVMDVYSFAVTAADRTSKEFEKGTSSAVNYMGRDTYAPQMRPSKIGRVVNRSQDQLMAVPKDMNITVVARNPAALIGAPFRQGYNQKQNSYKGNSPGVSTYETIVPLGNSTNAGFGACQAYAGTANYKNFGQLSAEAQLTQTSHIRAQTFTVGTVPRIPVIPSFPAEKSPVYQIWSTSDFPALYTSSGNSIDAQLPRDCNVLRLSGTLRLGGPVSAKPTQGGADTQIQQSQGMWINGNYNNVADGGGSTEAAGFMNAYGQYIWQGATNLPPGDEAWTPNSGDTAGYNAQAQAGVEQPAGGWVMTVELLGGATKVLPVPAPPTAKADARIIGRATLYGVLGTKNNVFYPCTNEAVMNPDWGSTVVDSPDKMQFSVLPSAVPIVTSESIGEINFSNLLVRPGMGMQDGEQVCLGEAITGARITMQAYTDRPSQGGVPREIPCLTNAAGKVAGVTITAAGAYAGPAWGAKVIFSPSPAGPQATATGVCVPAGVAFPAGVQAVFITNPGYGYTSAPTVTFSAGTTTATGTAVMGVDTASLYQNAQQFSFELSGVNGELIRYDSDASTSGQQIIIMDGLIPEGQTASSNITVKLAGYMTGKLKAYKSPIQLNTSRDDVANSKTMALALAEIAKYCPTLYANEISLQVSHAIAQSMGVRDAALHSASTGLGFGLWGIGQRMWKSARTAYRTIKEAVEGLSPHTKAALSNLAEGPEGQRVLRRVKGMVGLSNVPDATILRGAGMANRTLGQVFSSTDAGVYGGSDAGVHAGFFEDVGKGLGGAAPFLLPLLLDDGEVPIKHYANSSKGGYHAATFPILESSGKSAGKLTLELSSNPKRARKYLSFRSNRGVVYIDERFESVKEGKSTEAIEAAKIWLKKHPSSGKLYITIKEHIGRPLFGRSWEAALASALSGHDTYITGKVTHVTKDGRAHIGGIAGAREKSKTSPKLIVPEENADEAPTNRLVSTINVN